MIWHCQLGGLHALVDSDKHKTEVPAHEWHEGAPRKRRAVTQADAIRLALEWWGQMAYRAPDVTIRKASERDIWLFARMDEVRDSLRKPVGVREALF